jgi:hypothetical protein
MGTTTAGLPLTSGQHYEKCPADGTVYRTRRRTRFRCPVCHRLAYAVSTPEGEAGDRRTLEGDEQGRVFRVIARRPDEGEAAPAFGSDVVVFLEDPAPAAPPAGLPGPSPRPGDPDPAPSPTRRRAARDLDRGPEPRPTSRIGRIFRSSIGELFRGG